MFWCLDRPFGLLQKSKPPAFKSRIFENCLLQTLNNVLCNVFDVVLVERESRTLRINDIHELVHQLPESNFEMLDYLIAHLHRFVFAGPSIC